MPVECDPTPMRSRRTVLAAGPTLLAGCADPLGSGSEGCEELRSRPAASSTRAPDLFVANGRSERVALDLAVDGPDGRRCATLDLPADGNRTYRRVFEDDAGYELSVDVTTAPDIRGEYAYGPREYATRGIEVGVGSEAVSFVPYVR